MRINGSSGRHLDAALLLLRSAGLFLALTFGRQKVFSLWDQLFSGQSLGGWDLTQFLRHFHFPAPSLFSVLATLNESLVALFITAGFFTRISSLVAAAGMGVAFCISLKLGEEPLRALLYLAIFAAIALTGPGRFSIDYILERRPKSAPLRGE